MEEAPVEPAATPPRSTPTSHQRFFEQLKLEFPSTRKTLSMLQAIEEDNPTDDPEQMAMIIKDFWKQIWEERDTRPSPDHLDDYFEDYTKRIDSRSAPPIPDKETVRKTILATNNSCAGPDGIGFAVYRNLLGTATDVIHDMLVDLGKGIPPPPDFNHARLFIIPKSTSLLISNTRPISVTNAENRIIAKCITIAITPCLQDFLDEAQQGFLKKRRGATHIINIHDLYHSALDAKTQRLLLFMDTKKAFDSIDHDFIHKILDHIGLPLWMRNAVRGLMTDVFVIPVVSAETAAAIRISRGVKQGCPLSPLLFIICYDILIFKLKSYANDHIITLHIFAFADDIALGADDMHHLTQLMPIIDAFSHHSGLGLNTDKTKFISTLDSPSQSKIGLPRQAPHGAS